MYAPFERFNEQVKKVLALAHDEAANLGHGHIGTEHLLLGLMQEGRGLGARALEGVGVTMAAVRHLVEEVVPQSQEGEPRIPTARTRKVIELAYQAADLQGQRSVGTDHLLLGLVAEREGLGAVVLRNLGADEVTIRDALDRLRQEGE